MYTIGEFSKITGLTVKTLRFYHEKGVLAPTFIDAETGYRYYDQTKVETARIVFELRKLDFPLDDIAEILSGSGEEGDILEFLERQRTSIAARVQHYRAIEQSLDRIISNEREARAAMHSATCQISEKDVEPFLIAGVRMQGHYSECGKAFARIGRRFGRHICGKPLLLHFDTEYKEEDADFEACMPIRKGSGGDGITVRELPGGHCISLIHPGPYDDLGRSYARILEHVKQKGYEVAVPTREVYVKGPGMIFRGNPKKYLTEIQMLISGC